MGKEYWRNRKSELEGKLLRGLDVLDNLFEGILRDKYFSIPKYSKRVESLGLTQNQMDFYNNVIGKINNQREVIKPLSEVHKVSYKSVNSLSDVINENFTKEFEDPEKLYKFIFGTNKLGKIDVPDSLDGMRAFLTNIGIAFVLPEWNYSHKEFAARIEKKSEFPSYKRFNFNYANLTDFVMVLPSKKAFNNKIRSGVWDLRNSDSEIMYDLGGSLRNEALDEEFETSFLKGSRYLFDFMLGNTSPESYIEAPAWVYANSRNLKLGHLKDLKRIMDATRRSEKLIIENALDSDKKIYTPEDREKIEWIKNYRSGLTKYVGKPLSWAFARLRDDDLESRRKVSYLFSTFSLKKAAKRSEFVIDSFNRD